MENFPLLDVIVGLSLIYTCISLLASELTEWVITGSHWRTKYLTQYLLTLLGESSADDPALFPSTITSKLLNRSDVEALVQSSLPHQRSLILFRVAPHVLAAALLDVLQNLPTHPINPDQPEASISPIAALQAIVTTSPELSRSLQSNLMRLMHRVQTLEPDPERQMKWLEYEIERWFRYGMVESQNTYRQHFKLISLLISVGLTLTLNIDSLYIIRRISENTATRAMIMQNATHIHGCQSKLNSPSCTERLSRMMESTTIPVGWQPSNRRKQFAQLNLIILLRTIGGWFLSSLAIAMGSRFWLHLLHQLAIVLGRGRKPQRVLQSEGTDRDPKSFRSQVIELQEP
ncbi:MAG TPA: hypothetical protein V6C65_30480 [Allocoleopsis sp.]